MSAKCISFDGNQSHSTFCVTDYSNPTDFNMLPQSVGEYGTGDLHYNIGRPFDVCIDVTTGNSHWLTPENGWV